MISKGFTYIDLFCGIGGFHVAMESLGGKCVFACDIDKDCRKIYELNHGLKPEGDITKIDAKDIPQHDVLCAGFPCQPFSQGGFRLGFEDTRGTLFFDICRILEYHKPKYALLENVRNLVGHDHGNTWKVIHQNLINLGYNVPEKPIIFSPHFLGIPQNRERVFIMCIRKDVGELPEFMFDKDNIPECDIDDILLPDNEIENLDRYKLTQDQIDLIEVWDKFIRNIKCDKLPGFPIWNDYMTDNVTVDIPKWTIPFVSKNQELYFNNREFIDNWREESKSAAMFKNSRTKLEWQVGNVKNPSVWDNIIQFRQSGIRVKPGTYFPALVAVVQTSVVCRRKRYLTPRECARLQSYPDTFILDESDSVAYKQLGNSVNVNVVKLFARFLLDDEKIRREFRKNNRQLKLF